MIMPNNMTSATRHSKKLRRGTLPRALANLEKVSCTNSATIRRANNKDLPNIISLSLELMAYDIQFDDSMDKNWPKSENALEFYQERIKKNDGVIFIAEINGEISGCLIGCLAEPLCYRKIKTLAEIEEVFVLEKYRGSQVGSKLMDSFFSWAKEKHAERVQVVVSAANSRAISLYKKLGFKEHDVVLEQELSV
jgi:ribosomal protein S18 acetylase RimI-like enzyme